MKVYAFIIMLAVCTLGLGPGCIFTLTAIAKWECSSYGRALALHARGTGVLTPNKREDPRLPFHRSPIKIHLVKAGAKATRIIPNSGHLGAHTSRLNWYRNWSLTDPYYP
ncbi:hypothetical protein Tco_0998618 [Tanacetum coccineum]